MNIETPEETTVELAIEGMTCASCDVRIERKLDAVPGVAASVNFATERPTVRYDPRFVELDDLLSAVAPTGYRAALPSPRLMAICRKSAALAVPHRPSAAAYPAIRFYMGVPVTPRVCAVAFGFGRERLCKVLLGVPDAPDVEPAPPSPRAPESGRNLDHRWTTSGPRDGHS